MSATSTRARPSGATHSRAISGGIDSRVTGPACSAVRRSARSLTIGATIALATVARCAGLPSASRTRSAARRLAASAPGPVALPAVCSRPCAPLRSAATTSASLGAGLTAGGFKARRSAVAAARIRASFGS